MAARNKLRNSENKNKRNGATWRDYLHNQQI